MEPIYNRHYIRTDERGRVIEGWSDGPHPEKEAAGAICINERGGYQFRLFPDGEENPPLFTFEGVPLYKWNGQQVQPRADEEIDGDRAALPKPEPPLTEQQIAALALKQAQQETAIAQLQQVGAALMLQLAQAQVAGGGEVDA